MPDLLSHVLFAYAGATFASRYYPLTSAQTTACLVGAVLPDVSKLELFVDDSFGAALFGSPVNFLGWHTLAGIALSIVLTSLLVDERHRRPTVALVTAGAMGHVILDMFLRTASGLATYAIFWPMSGFRPQSPGLYLSGDPAVLLVAIVVAGAATLTADGQETSWPSVIRSAGPEDE